MSEADELAAIEAMYGVSPAKGQWKERLGMFVVLLLIILLFLSTR